MASDGGNAGLLKSLQAQIEFYFGNANMNKDRFLKKLVDADPEGCK